MEVGVLHQLEEELPMTRHALNDMLQTLTLQPYAELLQGLPFVLDFMIVLDPTNHYIMGDFFMLVNKALNHMHENKALAYTISFQDENNKLSPRFMCVRVPAVLPPFQDTMLAYFMLQYHKHNMPLGSMASWLSETLYGRYYPQFEQHAVVVGKLTKVRQC